MITKEQAKEQYDANPDLIRNNISATARKWGCSRGHVRNLIKGWQATGTNMATTPAETQIQVIPPVAVGRIVPRQRPSLGASRPVRIFLFLAALNMEAISGTYSIIGLTSIATGNYYFIIWLGVGFELAKVGAVMWLGQTYNHKLLKAALICGVLVLIVYNEVGAFGFISKSHIGTQVGNEIEVSKHLAEINAKITEQERVVTGFDQQLSQIDGAINKSISSGKINGAMDIANAQRNQRSRIEIDRQAAGKVLTDLKVEKAKIEGQGKVFASDLGPIKYLGQLLHINDEELLRYFILGIALILDPLAVVLLLASAKR